MLYATVHLAFLTQAVFKTLSAIDMSWLLFVAMPTPGVYPLMQMDRCVLHAEHPKQTTLLAATVHIKSRACLLQISTFHAHPFAIHVLSNRLNSRQQQQQPQRPGLSYTTASLHTSSYPTRPNHSSLKTMSTRSSRSNSSVRASSHNLCAGCDHDRLLSAFRNASQIKQFTRARPRLQIQ